MENSEPKEVQASVIKEQQPIIIQQHQQSKTNTKGVVGFVFSLLTIFLFWVPLLGTILGIGGFTFSLLGLYKEPKGLAIAGTIISIIMLPVVLVYYFGWKSLVGL